MTQATEIRKIAARKAATRQRQRARNPEHEAHAVARLITWLDNQPLYSIVAGYLAIGSEINPSLAMSHLHHFSGCQVCVPVTQGKELPLRFRQWRPDSTLLPGSFGVDVPVDGDWLTPDLVIVPLLAFDRHGTRLGYGGGYYDRSLNRLRAEKRVIAVGIAFAAQENELLPAEEFDAKLDAIVTEQEMIMINSAALRVP